MCRAPGAPPDRTAVALCSLRPTTRDTVHRRDFAFGAGSVSGAGSSSGSDRRHAVQPPAHDRRHRAQTIFRVRRRLCVGRRELLRIGPPSRCAASGPRHETPCTDEISRSAPALCRAPGVPPDRTAVALCSLRPTTGDTVHKRYFTSSEGSVSGAGSSPDRTAVALCSLRPTTGDTVHER